MQIKRFEAKTMTAALKMVKDEFGVNAVILSARSRRQSRGLFGIGRSAGVEVTAANDSGGSAFSATGSMVAGRPAASGASPAALAARRGLFQSLNDSLRSLTHRQRPVAADPAPAGPPSELAVLYRHLLAQEVERELASELIEQIQAAPGFDPLLGFDALVPLALRVLHDIGTRPAAEAPAPGAPRVRILVGPGGAGKTTTAIQLAARTVRQPEKRKVALLTLDDQRIGAVEQLRIYAAILRVPMAVATSPAMVRQAWQAFQSVDWLIVDTPGVGSAEPQRLNELRERLAPLKTREVELVLNACTREKDLARTIDAWRGLPVDRLAFTRLDEAGACGHLFNLLVRTRLPLTDLGTGPRIPEDFSDQGLAPLLRRIWPSREGHGDTRAASPGAVRAADALAQRGQWVANGNSELYHRSDCKWVRKIKSEHLIHFTSAAEAESRQFVACRNCHPQRNLRPDADAAGRSAVQSAGIR